MSDIVLVRSSSIGLDKQKTKAIKNCDRKLFKGLYINTFLLTDIAVRIKIVVIHMVV